MSDLNLGALVHDYLIPWGINILLALTIFAVGRWVVGLILNLVDRLLGRAKVDPMLIRFVRSILHTVLLLFVVIAALDQLGVDTTSFIALIGAAGLAIAMSLQGLLQNFAAGVLLIIFRPFQVGDFVEAGGVSGTVEEIGVFTTRMRTDDNREILVPNGAIYGGTITNYSARDTRRIDLVFGIGYDDDLKKAKGLIEEILASDERILKDPAPLVAVGELADSSVNLVVRPWVKREDYWSVLFDLNERIKLAFDDAGISIPYPQMDVHLHGQQSA